MISVVVIGYGKVAHHLINAFLSSETVHLVEVYARNISKINHLKNDVAITDQLHSLKNADIFIIAVSDDVITEISTKITNTSGIIVHTSGTVNLNQLNTKANKGVFYPLQSFSIDKKVDFNEVPFCLEAENPDDFKVIEKLAKSISNKTYAINSGQRQRLHVAAVFVNNFTNHLFKIGNDICEKHDVPFEILFPLIKETALKIEKIYPKLAQTGPAVRNDKQTIKKHLEHLNEEQQTIYKLLTKSIQNG